MLGNAPGDDRIAKSHIALVLANQREHVEPFGVASLVPDKLAKGRRNVVPVSKARRERTVGVLASALVLVGGRKALQLAHCRAPVKQQHRRRRTVPSPARLQPSLTQGSAKISKMPDNLRFLHPRHAQHIHHARVLAQLLGTHTYLLQDLLFGHLSLKIKIPVTNGRGGVGATSKLALSN